MKTFFDMLKAYQTLVMNKTKKICIDGKTKICISLFINL